MCQVYILTSTADDLHVVSFDVDTDLAFIHHAWISRSFDCRFVEYQMFTQTELHLALMHVCVCVYE